jgi:antitoxin PrlF
MRMHCQEHVTALPCSFSRNRPERSVPILLAAESTLTDRYQTTVPESVRRALQLRKRDRIQYTIRANGEVVLTRADAGAEEDPVLGEFLGFLARDIADHPERLQALDAGFVGRLQGLVGGVEVDLDAPLAPTDE